MKQIVTANTIIHKVTVLNDQIWFPTPSLRLAGKKKKKKVIGLKWSFNPWQENYTATVSPHPVTELLAFQIKNTKTGGDNL